MAFTITKVGSGFQNATGITQTISLSPSITIGQGIIVAIASNYSIASVAAVNATFDSVVQQISGSTVVWAGVATGIATGTVSSIVVTYSGSATAEVVVYAITGMATSGWQDQTSMNSSSGYYGTNPSIPATSGSISQQELVFNIFDAGASLSANGSGYTGLDSIALGGSGFYLITQYEIVSSGNPSGSVTLSSNGNFAGVLVTLASSSVTPNTVVPETVGSYGSEEFAYFGNVIGGG